MTASSVSLKFFIAEPYIGWHWYTQCLTFQHFCAFGNQDSFGYVCHVVTLMAVFVRPKAVFHAGVEWHQCHINKKKVL